MIKKNLNLKLWALAGLSLFLSACLQYDFPDSVEDVANLTSLQFPKKFKWSTQRQVDLQLSQNLTEEPLTVEIYYKIADRAQSIGRHSLEQSQSYSLELQVPSHVEELFLKPLSGLYQEELSLLVTENMTMSIAKSSFERKLSVAPESVASNQAKSNLVFSYLSPYTSGGKPKNVMPVRDRITTAMLNDINASLPEQRPVPTYNPSYLQVLNMDSKVVDPADVWITFVTEGAGWRNGMGFYTYDLKNPPKSVSDIVDLQIIFPNASLSASGGELMPGDKVYLGRYPANTGIGWFLVPNGWDGTKVNNTGEIKFSNPAFNTFTPAITQQHIVFLNDTARQTILLGFEDTSRPGGDNDFNDAVFYVTANPYTAIDVSDLNPTKVAVDTDQDGVLDHLDDYPKDPAFAYREFYPSANGNVGVAFEDMWPAQGDYDFNDLVFDLQYILKKNAKNQIVQLEASFNVKAIGGGHRNGLAIELNVAPELIKSVSGQLLAHNVFKVNGQGVEQAGSKSVIPVFDDAYDVFGIYTGSFINTEKGKVSVPAVKKTIVINFTTGVTLAQLGSFPFNPFLVVAKERGHEIHLANQKPTALADQKLFDTEDDASSEVGSYLNKNGLPWAILTTESFKYPLEKSPINAAHLRFKDWALSGGRSYPDWFMDKASYRDSRNIY